MDVINQHLKCPSCEKRLIDASPFVRSELRVMKDCKSSWKPDYIQKCNHCKNQIGIKKVC